jgi:hypothetical protein
MEKPNHEAATSLAQQDEIRCPRCRYFCCQRVLVEGKAILRFTCKSCSVRFFLTLTPESTTIGLV